MPHLVHNGDTKVHNIHQVRKPAKSAPGVCESFNLLWVFPFRRPVRTEGRCELKRKGCCSKNVRGSSLVSFRRPLPPEEREAFYVSRDFRSKFPSRSVIDGSWLVAAAPLIGEDLPVAYATGSLPPRDELPLINVQATQKPGL